MCFSTEQALVAVPMGRSNKGDGNKQNILVLVSATWSIIFIGNNDGRAMSTQSISTGQHFLYYYTRTLL